MSAQSNSHSNTVLKMSLFPECLAIRKRSFIRCDGIKRVEQRLLMKDEFNKTSSEDCLVFLLSTRAGGLGINLTSPNNVIIHDIDFNRNNNTPNY